jgi:hypothetical protein
VKSHKIKKPLLLKMDQRLVKVLVPTRKRKKKATRVLKYFKRFSILKLVSHLQEHLMTETKAIPHPTGKSQTRRLLQKILKARKKKNLRKTEPQLLGQLLR